MRSTFKYGDKLVLKEGSPLLTNTSPIFIDATGGTITYDGDYKIHTFTSNGTFIVSVAGDASVLLVGAGGGGGTVFAAAPSKAASGGGGGGEVKIENILLQVGIYDISIGLGATATDGGNSYFGILEALGGKKGESISADQEQGLAGDGGNSGNENTGGFNISGTWLSNIESGGGGGNGGAANYKIPGPGTNVFGTIYGIGGYGRSADGGGSAGSPNSGEGGEGIMVTNTFPGFLTGDGGAGGSGIVVIKYKFQ